MDATPNPPRPSFVDPVSHAIDWTGKVLFRPFDIGKWFTLGFCAWLAWIGQNGSSGSGLNWTPRDHEGGAVVDWFDENLALIVLIAILLFVVIGVLVVLFTWLSSRGKFMFLDGVVHDRSAVTQPWHRFRERGNSLFGFRIVIGLLAVVVFTVLIGLMVLSLVGLGVDGYDLGGVGIVALVGWILLLISVVAAFALVGLAVNDFIVPIMWLRDCRVMEAWPELRRLVSAHTGAFVGYVLLKFVLAIGILFVSCLATCLTCCVAALPYIGTVILLPFHVFRRSYSMYFLAQFGPDYAALGPVEMPPPAPPIAPSSPATSAPEPSPPSSPQGTDGAEP